MPRILVCYVHWAGLQVQWHCADAEAPVAEAEPSTGKDVLKSAPLNIWLPDSDKQVMSPVGLTHSQREVLKATRARVFEQVFSGVSANGALFAHIDAKAGEQRNISSPLEAAGCDYERVTVEAFDSAERVRTSAFGHVTHVHVHFAFPGFCSRALTDNKVMPAFEQSL